MPLSLRHRPRPYVFRRNDRFTTPPDLPGASGFDPSLPVSPGFSAEWQTVSHTLTLTDADHATSTGTNPFYAVDGQVYRIGCSTAIAERLQ